MIHFSEIENLSTKFGVSQGTVEKDYCLTWFLIALSSLKENKNLIFYGGTALKKIYFPDYRFSEDIDFISSMYRKTENILSFMERLYEIIKDRANISFSTEKETIERQGHRLQFFLVYDGFPELEALNKRIKVDILSGIEPLEEPLPKKLCCGYADMKGLSPKLFTYPLETIATDKVGTIISTTRTEPRDLYDLWFLLKNCNLDFNKVKSNFKDRFGYALDWPVISPGLHNALYRERWAHRLSRQVASLPDFDKVLAETEQNLKRFLARIPKAGTYKILSKKERTK